HSYKDKADKNLRKYLGTNEKDAKLSLTFFTVSFAVLLVGGLLGLVQGLERAGLLTLPNWFNYYQVLTVYGVFLILFFMIIFVFLIFLYCFNYYQFLTVYGVLLILVFTITFLIGYFYAGVSHTLGGLLPRIRKMGWISFGLIMAGVALAASQIIIGEASVLYT